MKKYKILVNGAMYNSKKVLQIYSPENNKMIGEVSALSADEINKIFDNAKISFNNWSNLDYKIRIKYILNFAKLLLKNKKILASVMVNEIAKPFNDGIKEVERSYQYILETIEEYKKSFLKPIKMVEPKTNGKISYLERVPLGIVLAISPFNYPINLSLSKIIPALLLGNTVVFKPATQGSISGALLSQYFHNVKLPKNVFNIVTGKGSEIGDLIVTNKNIDMISFTGGFDVGNRISKENYTIPKVLELGGKDPAIVLKDAKINKAINEIVKGSLSYSGQRCTAIKIVYVEQNIYKKVVDGVIKKVSQLSIGSAKNNNDITSLISKSSVSWAKELIEDAKNKGAKILLGDKYEGNILYPTVITNINNNMKIFDEEQFAPIIPIMSFTKIDEVIKNINNSKYGLQASIFTESKTNFNKISKKINCGTVNYNSAPARGPDMFPFSGIKQSGFGVQGIYWALESMTRIKLIVK